MRWSETAPGFRTHALLFLLAYVFLLRLPSEALPVGVGADDPIASLKLEGDNKDKLVLRLARRSVHLGNFWPRVF